MMFSVIHEKCIVVSEDFHMESTTHLLSLWKDFKNYLKHKWKEKNMEQLVQLRIESDNCNNDEKVPIMGGSKANVVKHDKNS